MRHDNIEPNKCTFPMSDKCVSQRSFATYVKMAALRWPQLLSELRGLVKSFQCEHLDTSVQQHKQTFLSLLERYKARTVDFSQYMHFDDSGYTKNLVEEIEGHACNVIIMCWAPGQQSAFHSHEGSRCFVKVLTGQLNEQQVECPTNDDQQRLRDRGATQRLLRENQVTYIDDSIGLHKVSNQSVIEPAVTLHVYLPAYTRCRIFQAESAEQTSLDKSYIVDVEFIDRLKN